VALAPQAQAQPSAPYPQQPVRIVVGFAAGTGPDMVARLLAQKLSETWSGAAVVVDNKTGAAGIVAGAEVARARPDGHTLFLAATGQLSIAPHTHAKLPYDPVRDFQPVSTVAESEFVLLTNPQKVPARDARGFVAWSQKQKSLFMGSFGAGTAGHFGAYILGDAIQVTPEVVHYRATADVVGGLLNGDIQGVFASVGLAAAQVKTGRLVALGSTGQRRTAALPEVPTFREQGLPDLAFTTWFGIVAPAATPAPLIARISADIQKTLSAEDTRRKIEDAGFQPIGSSADALRQTIARDSALWGKAVAKTGFKVTD
jgi:tripartite-type tricarboxylate transporter receptor subunit TctC